MLALICGSGSLPALLAGAQEKRPLVCVLDGFAPVRLQADHVFRLETLGTLLSTLREQDVTQVCLAGSIRRPQIDPALIDAATRPLVPQLQAALGLGDDGALRIVLEIFEQAGFAIVAAQDLLAPLILTEGVPTRAQPKPQHRLDARLGERTVSALGARDAGQACVVAGGEVLAREDAAGTDAMLARLARARQTPGGWDPISASVDMLGGLVDSAAGWLSGGSAPAGGGLLFKAPKPGQDRRADLPVIGPNTADAVAAAGLEGIVIEAGGVMVLHAPEVVARLDAAGLFLWVRKAGA